MGYVNSIREYYDRRRRRHLLCLLVTSVWATWKKRKKERWGLIAKKHTHTQTERTSQCRSADARNDTGWPAGQLVFSWSAQKKNGTRERDVIIACYYSPFWYFGNSRSPRLCVSLVAQAERHILYNRSLLKIWRMAPISVTRCGGWLDCSRRRISSGRPTKAAK